jgi:hypothetical protein
LSNISNVIAVRAAIFGILWVLLGKRVWFFPNLNAEETTFRELVRFWPEKDGERPKWTSRLFYALVALLVILLLTDSDTSLVAVNTKVDIRGLLILVYENFGVHVI